MDVSYVNDDNRIVDQVQPGTTVGVRVRADPGSTAHILAVDKSILLLKTGNDIDPVEVIKEINFNKI